MFTVIGMLKRKPGMSIAQFIDYYENHHAKLGERLLLKALSYKRRYLHPAPYPLDGTVLEAEYDVLTETVYPDRATYEAEFGALANPGTLEMIVEDEEKLFDRTRSRLMFVEEHASDMGHRPE